MDHALNVHSRDVHPTQLTQVEEACLHQQHTSPGLDARSVKAYTAEAHRALNVCGRLICIHVALVEGTCLRQ